MSRRTVGKALGLLALASRLPGPSRAAARSAGQPKFRVFDGLMYLGKPDLRPAGLTRINWIGDLWRAGVSHDEVDDVQVRALFAPLRTSRGYYYLDIENWGLLGVSDATRRRNIDKLTQVIDLARAAAPSLQIGFYGLLPGITYWPLQRHDDAYREWLMVNQQLEPLAQHVDAVFPSLYTFYLDLEGWQNYARQTLKAARRYGKPVYAFLWPEFHDSTDLAGQHVPDAYWRAELELCVELADGIVLWGGWQQQWNEKASWWRETRAFLGAHAEVLGVVKDSAIGSQQNTRPRDA
jgi:hypothetical protein